MQEWVHRLQHSLHDNTMPTLLLGLLLFLGAHSLQALFPNWRAQWRSRWGEMTYKGLYSLLSLAGLVLVVLGALAWCWKRQGLQVQGRWLNGLLLWQWLTGLSNVLLDWPLLSAVAHTGGAAALAAVLTWAIGASHARAFEQERAPSAPNAQGARP